MSFATKATALLGFVFSLAVIIATHATASATIITRAEARFAPALHHELSRKQEERLEQSLRRLTGFYALRFTEAGELALNKHCAFGGSTTARELLHMALEPDRLFIIEDHSQSSSVYFGQLDEGLNYSDDSCAHTQMQVWRVRIDFRDFADMQAAPEVRESFDEGITLLHELLHGFGLKDTPHRHEVGQCELIVNQVRTELGLPLRDAYFGEQQTVSSFVSTVRLKFKSRIQRASGLRWKSHYLFFLAERKSE